MATRLEINDPYELIHKHKVRELPNGQILVLIYGLTSFVCEHYTQPYSDNNMKFYDEEHSWQECVVTLVHDHKNLLTKYKRFDTMFPSEHGPHPFGYLFVPMSQLINIEE